MAYFSTANIFRLEVPLVEKNPPTKTHETSGKQIKHVERTRRLTSGAACTASLPSLRFHRHRRVPSLQTLSVFHYRSDRQWTNCPVTKNAPLVVVSCPRAQKGIRTPSPALRQSARLVLFSQSCARAPTLLTNHVLYSTFQPWDGPPRVLRAVGANPLLRENHVTSERGHAATERPRCHVMRRRRSWIGWDGSQRPLRSVEKSEMERTRGTERRASAKTATDTP